MMMVMMMVLLLAVLASLGWMYRDNVRTRGRSRVTLKGHDLVADFSLLRPTAAVLLGVACGRWFKTEYLMAGTRIPRAFRRP